MALLEEAARQLYREWFVRLRFPGHEHTRIANGVPEGWQSDKRFACRRWNPHWPFGSQTSSTDYTEEGVPVVMPKDIISFRICVDDIARIPESLADSLARHRMQEGDVVYGRRGDIGRRGFIFSAAGWLALRHGQPAPEAKSRCRSAAFFLSMHWARQIRRELSRRVRRVRRCLI